MAPTAPRPGPAPRPQTPPSNPPPAGRPAAPPPAPPARGWPPSGWRHGHAPPGRTAPARTQTPAPAPRWSPRTPRRPAPAPGRRSPPAAAAAGRLQHLPLVLASHRRVGKVVPTPGAPVGRAHHDVVRVGYLRQRDPRIARLLAGPAPRPATQRPVGDRAWLLGGGTVGAGRPVGVRRVPARLPLQLRHPLGQDRHLRPQSRDQRVPCRQLGLVQHGPSGDHPPQFGVDRPLTPQRRAQLLDRQGGQLARRLRHGRHDRHADSRRSTRSAHGILSSCRRSPRPRSPSLNSYLAATVVALEEHGFSVEIVNDLDAARDAVLARIPSGSSVMTNTSVTLQETGIAAAINDGGPYDSTRNRMLALDFATQAQEMKAIGGQPDYALGSVHAVTRDGTLVIASASGSQLASYAWGAAKVVFAVGAQKLVPTLEAAHERIYQHSLKLEDARAIAAYGQHSSVGKILEIHQELPGRIHIVLILQSVGF